MEIRGIAENGLDSSSTYARLLSNVGGLSAWLKWTDSALPGLFQQARSTAGEVVITGYNP